MNALQELIQEEKKRIEGSQQLRGSKKWVQKSLLNQIQEEELRKGQKLLEKKRKLDEQERLKNIADYYKKNKSIEDETLSSSKTISSISGGDSELFLNSFNADDKDGVPPMPRTEIFRKLRRLREPVTLFGETPMLRYERLCKLEVLRHEDELKMGQQNAFLDRYRDRRHSQEDDEDEDDDESEFNDDKSINPSCSNQKDTNDADKLHSSDLISNSINPVDGQKDVESKCSNESVDGTTDNNPSTGISTVSMELEVRRWIKHMLKEWEEELKNRTDVEKKSAIGKRNTNLHRQTRKDLKPLLRKLKTKSLEHEVLEKLSEMVNHCNKRQYRDAHHVYMLLAIGNAAWPMGVTMVGIHERAGRTKIFTSQVAHILNDETTRKYIQMFKRLMSFCQNKYPTSPSQTIKISTTSV